MEKDKEVIELEGKKLQDETTELEFQKLISLMRSAGETLTQIRARNRWIGTEEFVIPHTDGQMSIHFEKIIKDGQKYVRIMGWSNIPIVANLPAKYLAGGQAVFFQQGSGEDKDNAIILPGKGYVIKIGSEYHYQLWEEGKRYFTDCAKHLKNVLESVSPIREETII